MAVLAAEGATSAQNSVASWGIVMGTIGIETRGAGVPTAPAAVWLKAVSPQGFDLSTVPAGTAYDPALHEITYVWTVRGRPLAAFSAPENMVTGWNDPNMAYGADVAFSFPEPGSYEIDLWCVDRTGVTASATTTVSVIDPDAVYPGSQTLCLAHDGDFAGAPAGAQQFTSVASFVNAIESLSAPGRALFKRGGDYTDFSVGREGNFQYLGAWGTGADPVVRPPRSGQLATLRDMAQFTVTGIDFQGGWDAATGTGSPDDHAFFPRDNGTACWYHYHGCRFSGFEIFEPTPGSTSASTGGCIFSDTIITNWRDYAIFLNGRETERYLAVLGCRFAQNPDALNGGPKNGLYNNHGPIRISNITNVYIAQSDLFSRNGWSALAPDIADQPCIRLNSSPTAPGNRANIDRVVCEGGFYQISLEGQNSDTLLYESNYVLDKVLSIASARSITRFVAVAVGGTTIRNLIGIVPNVPAYHSNGWQGGITFSAGNGGPASLASPVALYSTSVVNLRSAENDPGHNWQVESGKEAFGTWVVENNLAHAPGLDTPVAAAVDLSTPIPGIALRYKGVRFGFDHEEGTLAADVTAGTSLTVAYPVGTDHAYWQAIQATDTRHMIRGIGSALLAEEGDFTVSFEAGGVTLTNTSGRTWEAGKKWKLRLDRKSLMPPMDATYASPPVLPLPRPMAAEIGTADIGLSAWNDSLGEPRPTTGDTRGALLPE